MENLGMAGLIIAYVALAVLLLSLFLYTSLGWWIKAPALVLVSSFYYVSYVSFPQLLGWPTPYGLPERLYIIAATVEEPQAVYLWARDLSHGLRITRPRAYKLPYSKKLHEKVELVTRKLRRAIPVIGEITVPGREGTFGEGVLSTPVEVDVNFIDAPDALIPEKE